MSKEFLLLYCKLKIQEKGVKYRIRFIKLYNIKRTHINIVLLIRFIFISKHHRFHFIYYFILINNHIYLWVHLNMNQIYQNKKVSESQIRVSLIYFQV